MPPETDPYSDAAMPAEAPAETPAPEEEVPAPEQEEASEEVEPERGLLPKSMFPGDCKPGEKFSGEVVAVHDDEIEVKLNKPYGKEKSYGEASEGSDSEMSGMME